MKKILFLGIGLLSNVAYGHEMDGFKIVTHGVVMKSHIATNLPETWSDLLITLQTNNTYNTQGYCVLGLFDQLPIFLDILQNIEENATTKAAALQQQMAFIGKSMQNGGTATASAPLQGWFIWSSVSGNEQLQYATDCKIYPLLKAFLVNRSQMSESWFGRCWNSK